MAVFSYNCYYSSIGFGKVPIPSSWGSNPLPFPFPFPCCTSKDKKSSFRIQENNAHNNRYCRQDKGWFSCKAMAQDTTAFQGASAFYAKEMERLSAKESLLLAFKDAGGFKALVTGRVTDMHRIDVNERIVGLERLNPTPRPTTSPFLEGRWNFEWFGDGSAGFLVARLVFERFPTAFASLSKMDVVIKDGNANITSNLKFVNSIESNFILSTKLSVEGPLRMKEEYVEGILESPKINEETIPIQLKGAFGQVTDTMQQLPLPIKEAVTSGLKIPLGGSFQRLFMISYLDEEILIIRNSSGVPEVLTRLDFVPSPMEDPIAEYES